MDVSEYRECLEDIVRLTHEYRDLASPDEIIPELSPGASEQEISALAKRLVRQELPFPDSLRNLLRASNGVRDFFYELDLRPAQEIALPNSGDSCWSGLDTEAYRFVLLSGRTSAFGGFDPQIKSSEGDFQITIIQANGSDCEFDGLADMIRFKRSNLVQGLEDFRADRANLADD